MPWVGITLRPARSENFAPFWKQHLHRRGVPSASANAGRPQHATEAARHQAHHAWMPRGDAVTTPRLLLDAERPTGPRIRLRDRCKLDAWSYELDDQAG